MPQCFARPFRPSLLVPWPHSVFLTFRNCFWHLQTPATPRSASSSAWSASSSAFATALQGLSCLSLGALATLFRNCFLAPSNAYNPSQRLQQCQSASETASWPLQLPKLLRGPVKPPFTAPPAAYHAILRVPWPHSVFVTFRNCLLAPSNAYNPSQRLQQCLKRVQCHRDCFKRPTSLASCAAHTANLRLFCAWFGSALSFARTRRSCCTAGICVGIAACRHRPRHPAGRTSPKYLDGYGSLKLRIKHHFKYFQAKTPALFLGLWPKKRGRRHQGASPFYKVFKLLSFFSNFRFSKKHSERSFQISWRLLRLKSWNSSGFMSDLVFRLPEIGFGQSSFGPVFFPIIVLLNLRG